MEYQDKFNMTIEQNIFVAKRNIVDLIYKSAKIEGINVTYSETQEIIDGGNIAHLRVDEIVTINNLKNAWKYVLNSVKISKLDFNYLCYLNGLVGNSLVENAGKLRYADVKIGGTTYQPALPDKNEIDSKINYYLSNKNSSVTLNAIEIMCYLMRAQIFFDGNKRTSMLFANSILIQNGKGIISVSDNNRLTFNTLLTAFYETNDNSKLKKWLYDNCIDGINF